MVAPIKTALDDGLLQLQNMDLSGGLVTNIGAFALSANQTPDALNCYWTSGDLEGQGYLKSRGGYSLVSTLANTSDRLFRFFDVNNIPHLMLWSGGNLYDCRTGTPSLITSSVYTAGSLIGVTVLNNKLYWCTPGVPLRYYDGTTEAAVPNSGGTGVVPPPSASYLTVYNGQIVACQPVVSAVTYQGSIMWSDVNDPTTWFGANILQLGSNDGGAIQWALPLGIPALIIGKSQGSSNLNLFLLTGALSVSGLNQSPISCPVAALDPYSACVIPSKQGLSTIMFLASDYHFWQTNGVECWMASRNILPTTQAYIQGSLLANANQRFFSYYYTNQQYYICSVGQQTHFIFRPENLAWWLFQGWPSGDFASFTLTKSSGLPALFTAANSPGTSGLYEIAISQATDIGSNPTIYYCTPYLHGGKIEREKQFQWFALATYNVGTTYNIDGYSIPRADGFVYNMDTLNFADPAESATTISGVGIWNVSLWNQFVWGGGNSTIAQPYQPCMNHAPIRYTTAGTIWVPAGEKAPLKSGAVQFKISWAGGVPDFQVLGYNVRYLERSFQFVGNALYQPVGGVISETDPYTTTGPN